MIDKNRMKRPDSLEKVRASRAGRARVFRLNWRRESVPVLVFLAFAIGILGCIRVNAQIRDGTLSGKVTSPSGAPLANARLVLKNIARSDVRPVTLNSDGTYTAVNLLPGTYEITASAQGFEDAHATVAITSDGKPVVNLLMRATSVTRAGRGQAGSSTLKGDVTSSISELPLNGRSASDVAALEPGVATARTQTSGQAQRGFGTEMTISGGRPRQNDSRLDGISLNDYSNGPPGSALGVNLGVDAVEQFTVLTSNYPARHGRSSGGIIGASTRSGTNEFHGSVYEFFRNSALDARNFFDTKKPPFRRNQFGASLGGPIIKDRTFIFGDYEGLRSSTGVTQVDTVPSAAARAGKLSTGQIQVDATVLSFVNALYPLPNGPLLGAGDTGIFTFSGQQVTPENYFTTKVDHKLSERDAVSGTYMFDTGTVRQPDELNDKRTGYDSRRQMFTLSETHTFNPHSLSSFRFGINRVVATTGLTFPSGNPHASDGSFSAVPGENAPGVQVTGLTQFSGGLESPSHFNFHWTSIQAYEDLSSSRGKHTLKFGVGFERIRDNMLAVSDTGGVFSFNQLSDFLTNTPFFLSAAIPSAVTGRGIRQTIVGAYIQDDWRWRPNLTVNLGLRYEMATVPTEVQGKLTTFRHITDAIPHLGDPLFSNPTLRNFEPRVGLSWDPFGGGKTAISAGFGMFDVLPLPYLIQFNELFSAPFFEAGSATNLPVGSFPSTAFAIVAGSSNTFRQAYFDPHPRRNYVMQWNLTIQRELAKDLSAMVGYVGSRGVHQPFRVEDVDIVLPTLTSEGYLWPSPAGSGTRLNLNAGRITAGFWDGDSYYDALEVQIKKKIARGSLEVSYTWGKSIDTSSGSLVGDEYTNSISSPLFFNPRLNRGLSDFNVAQNLEVNYTWEIGTPNWASGSKAWVLGGWQIGGVFEASTGVPFTPGLGGDALGVKSTDPNIDVPNLIGGPGCGSLVNSGNPVSYIKTECFAVPNPITLRGNLGRNKLIGPGLVNFDFSLFKNNYIKRISDRFNAQFRAEFFNILNHPNFAPPLDNRNIFDSAEVRVGNAGLITSTQTPSRQIQFAVKLIW
jgi:Carboxypeptidase regulatory-like domain/TonB dependent receptor-like, beta-barrel